MRTSLYTTVESRQKNFNKLKRLNFIRTLDFQTIMLNVLDEFWMYLKPELIDYSKSAIEKIITSEWHVQNGINEYEK